MDTLDSVIKFVSSYPAWAKLLITANAVCVIAVLVFAPRSSAATDKQKPPGTKILKVKRVELFPDSDTTEVQVSVFVNGTEFRYPSLAGVEWMKVAPSMASQSFKLPEAEQYEVRFEMRTREKAGGPEGKLVSVTTVNLKNAPFEGAYALHGFDPSSRTRSGTVSAQVVFSFETIP